MLQTLNLKRDSTKHLLLFPALIVSLFIFGCGENSKNEGHATQKDPTLQMALSEKYWCSVEKLAPNYKRDLGQYLIKRYHVSKDKVKFEYLFFNKGERLPGIYPVDRQLGWDTVLTPKGSALPNIFTIDNVVEPSEFEKDAAYKKLEDFNDLQQLLEGQWTVEQKNALTLIKSTENVEMIYPCAKISKKLTGQKNIRNLAELNTLLKQQSEIHAFASGGLRSRLWLQPPITEIKMNQIPENRGTYRY